MADFQFNAKGNEYPCDAADVAANKGISILCYFGILLLIPMLTKKDSQYAKFHSNQGLLLLILSMAGGLLFSILGMAVGGSSFLATVVGLLSGAYNIAVTALFIIGLINVCGGKMKELPFIGSIRILK